LGSDEFVLALFLTQCALAGEILPRVLPNSMLPKDYQSDSASQYPTVTSPSKNFPALNNPKLELSKKPAGPSYKVVKCHRIFKTIPSVCWESKAAENQHLWRGFCMEHFHHNLSPLLMKLTQSITFLILLGFT
jgi:hypothetical protein